MDNNTDNEYNIAVEAYERDHNLMYGKVYTLDKGFFVQGHDRIIPTGCRGMLLTIIPEWDVCTFMIVSRLAWLNGKIAITHIDNFKIVEE